MNRNQARQMLEQALAELSQAREHLDYSFRQVASLPEDLVGATPAQLESAEAFSSRFARVVDLLVNKVLRSLDRVELLPQGTLLDVVNRAEKRGVVPRAADLREMKDIRNVIAHDYAGAHHRRTAPPSYRPRTPHSALRTRTISFTPAIALSTLPADECPEIYGCRFGG